eukprot:COSAG02_NODE_4530_length_5252_cov_5.919658_8_plen_80_part_00
MIRSQERNVALVFDPEVRLDSDEPGYKHGHFRIAAHVGGGQLKIHGLWKNVQFMNHGHSYSACTQPVKDSALGFTIFGF